MENKIIPPPSRNTPINIDFTVSEAEIVNPFSLNDKIIPANIMENTPPKTIAGLILFNLPHRRERVNPAKPSAEISAARFPFIPLKERPPLTIIKIPIIEKINAHQVAFRIGSFSKGQAKIAVRNGAQANKKAAFAMEVVWKAYILPAKAKTRDIAAVKPAKPIFVRALRGCPFDCQYI